MTAAPRCCTVGMKVSLNQLSSTRDSAGLPLDGGVVQIGILSRRMVAPDDDLFDLAKGAPAFFRELRESAVVIETSHRGESIAAAARAHCVAR